MTRRAEGTVRALRGSDEPGLELAPGLRLPVETVTETLAIIANRGVGKALAVDTRPIIGHALRFNSLS